MPRIAENERPRILAQVRAYLALAANDRNLGLTHDDIAKGAKVGKRHLSRDDHPDFLDLAAEIETVRLARNPSPPSPAIEPGAAAGPEQPAPGGAGALLPAGNPGESHAALGIDVLSIAQVEARLRRAAEEARRIMQVFLGHHRGACAASDAPLLLHDLDKAIGGLRRQAEVLRPLVEEIQQRERTAAPPAAGRPSLPTDPQVPLF